MKNNRIRKLISVNYSTKKEYSFEVFYFFGKGDWGNVLKARLIKSAIKKLHSML